MLAARSLLLLLFVVVSIFFIAARAQSQVIVVQSGESPEGNVDNCRTVGNVTHCESIGNLASTYSLSCMPLSEMKYEYTPADIYPAVADCLRAERYPEAVDLFLIAGVYAYFDRLRVTDRTAHQGAQVLVLNAFGSVEPPKREKWKAYLEKRAAGGRLDATGCDEIRRLGPPNYFPSYMIQHGMKALMNETVTSPLVESFNKDEAWKTALDKYLHCPAL